MPYMPTSGVAAETLVAGGFMLTLHRLIEHHPERVAGRDAVAAGEHEAVRERVLRLAQVVAQATHRRTSEVDRDVVGRIGKRSAEVPGLRVVAEQDQPHGGHERDVLEPLAVVFGKGDLERRGPALRLDGLKGDGVGGCLRGHLGRPRE